MTQTVKKSSIIIMVALIIATMSLSVLMLPSKTYADTVPYEVGDIGPAGGYIFYVDGSYCLEVAPDKLEATSYWSNIADASVSTEMSIGSGQSNTTKIINQSGHTSSAAKLCDDYSVTYEGTVYDDWFLPSFYELQEIWVKIYLQNIGNISQEYYWSSSEDNQDDAVYDHTADYTEAFLFGFNGWVHAWPKEEIYYVLPVRAFEGMKEVEDSDSSNNVEEEKVWVRNHEMTCWQVWINEDNNFEFVFWWEYENNNHVQIFDMAGNLVWETDFEKGDSHFVAELPDGMYTVKTFHEYGHILQEFLIGKP